MTEDWTVSAYFGANGTGKSVLMKYHMIQRALYMRQYRGPTVCVDLAGVMRYLGADMLRDGVAPYDKLDKSKTLCGVEAFLQYFRVYCAMGGVFIDDADTFFTSAPQYSYEMTIFIKKNRHAYGDIYYAARRGEASIPVDMRNVTQTVYNFFTGSASHCLEMLEPIGKKDRKMQIQTRHGWRDVFALDVMMQTPKLHCVQINRRDISAPILLRDVRKNLDFVADFDAKIRAGQIPKLPISLRSA